MRGREGGLTTHCFCDADDVSAVQSMRKGLYLDVRGRRVVCFMEVFL